MAVINFATRTRVGRQRKPTPPPEPTQIDRIQHNLRQIATCEPWFLDSIERRTVRILRELHDGSEVGS